MSLLVTVNSNSESSDEEQTIPVLRKRRRFVVPDFSQSSPESPIGRQSHVYTSEIDKFSINKDKFSAEKLNETDEPSDGEDFFLPTGHKRVLSERLNKNIIEVLPKVSENCQSSAICLEDSYEEPLPRRRAPARRSSAEVQLLKSLENASRKFYRDLELSDQDESFLSMDDSFDNRELIVKVRCRTSIERLTLRAKDPFSLLLPKLAVVLKTCEEKIVLTLKNNTLLNTDSPATVNLLLADIIDCIILSNDESSSSSGLKPTNPNILNILFQSKNDRKKVTLTCHKEKALKETMLEYAKEKGLNIDSLIFKFDGDIINGDNTPNELDLDDGDCIDVILN